MRQANDVMRQRTQLVSELGALPRDLGQFGIERDLLAVAHRIVAVLEEHEVAEEVQFAILRAVDPSQHERLEIGEADEGEDEVVEAEVVT